MVYEFASITAAFKVIFVLMITTSSFLVSIGRISGVSAWTSSTRGASFRRQLVQSTTTTYGRQQQQQQRNLASSTALQFRGGDEGHENNSDLSRTFASSSSALHASVTDKNEAETCTREEAEQSEEDDDALSPYRAAFELNLPILDFGGLSFWKTTNDDDEAKQLFRVLFVLGGPGAGKGTQSDLMAQNYPVVHLSAGELLRGAAQDPECEHRELIQDALVGGKIVPVKISLSLLQAAMQTASKTTGSGTLFLVDGFPRNQDNLSGWCEFMEGVASVWSVLFYSCPLEVLEGRILERAKSSGRSDDNLESLHKRFGTFEKETMPIVEQLKQLADNSPWSVVDIAGNQSLDDVWESTQETLNQLIQHDVLSANADLLQRETSDENILDQIKEADIDFVSGKKVIVSYTRPLEKEQVRETCTWEYQGQDGWQSVNIERTSL